MASDGVVVFADTTLTKSFGDIKQLFDESVSINKKSIIIGNNGNWKLKWKDVESFDVVESGYFIWMNMAESCDIRKVRLKIRQEHLWDDVIEYATKRWKRLQQREEEELAPAVVASTSKAVASRSSLPFRRQGRATYASKQRGSIVPYKRLVGTGRKSKEILQKKQADDLYAPSDNDDDDDNNNNGEDELPHDSNHAADDQRSDQNNDDDEQIDEVEKQAKPEPVTSLEDSDTEPRSRQPKQRFRRLRINTARKDESDDEDFFSPAPLTTPSVQRVVSPTDILAENVDHHDSPIVDDSSRKPISTKSTLSNFFATGPKSSSSTESTADKVLKSHSRLGRKKDVSPKFNSKASIKTSATKSLAPLKRDDGWLSQQSPALSPIKLNNTRSPLSPQRDDTSYASPTAKRGFDDVQENIEEYRSPTTPSGKRIRHRLRGRLHPHPHFFGDGDDAGGMDNNDATTNTVAKANKGGEDKSTTDIIETRSRSSSPRSSWKGLRNMGNTCYLNASLQMLYSVGNFVNALASGWSGNLTRSIVTVSNSLKMPTSPYSRSPDAKPVKLAIDKVTDKFEGYLQRDAHEFLSDLIDQVHDELEAEVKQRNEPKTGLDDTTQESSEGEAATEAPAVRRSTTTYGINVLETPSTSDNSTGTKDMSIDGAPSQSTTSSEQATTVNAATSLPTDDYFRLNLQVQLQCTCCGYTRSKEELYRHLSLDVTGPNDAEEDDTTAIAGNIQTSLEQFFQPEEVEIKCEKCDTGDRAVQTLRILSQPKALLLHLKRFVVVEERQASPKASPNNEESSDMQIDETPSPVFSLTFQKNKSRVEIPERLTLDSFRLESDSTDPYFYNLKSVVHHIGNTASSGHYTAHGLRLPPSADPESAPTWVSFDDGMTKETTTEEVVSSIRSQRTAYMLMYACDD